LIKAMFTKGGGDELHAYPGEPLFPKKVFHALVFVFGVSVFLAANWFGLLLINSEGVVAGIGILNALRVNAVLMAGIAVPSALLMLHYKCLYTYTSEEDSFFAITFSIAFLLGSPCALVGIFG
jgi:nitrate reductase gamma subunit